jgi:hypothetical protein
MNFSQRVAAISAVVLVTVLGVMAGMSLRQQWSGVEANQRNELAAVSLMLRSSLARTGSFALAEAEMVARQPEVARAAAAQDRQALTARLKDGFAYLKAETGVEIFQFQTADLKILLRVHDPARFGDDVANSRPIVVTANRSRRGQRGIEFGPTGLLTLRGVAPVIDDGQLVATAEIGFDLKPILQSVKAATGAEAAIVLSAAMTGRPAAERQSFGDLYLYDSTDNRLFGRLFTSTAVTLAKDAVQLDSELDGEIHGMIVEPLLDYSGRMIGGIVAAKNFTAPTRAFRRNAGVLLFVALCGLMIGYGVIVVSVRAFVARPLAALADYAEARTGAGDERPPPAGGSADIDRIARVLVASRSMPAAPGGSSREAA